MPRPNPTVGTDVSGWCALVTGASSGIGEACAWKLAEMGTRLVLVARRKERLERVQKEIEEAFPDAQVHAVVLDVTDTEKVSRFMEGLPRAFRDVDILINNAGLASEAASVNRLDLMEAKIMVDTNVTSLIAFSRIVSPGMVARRRGHIVNVCSVAGHEAFSDMSVYCATKHAALAFTDCTRHDLVGTPIRVTAISPGAVKTDLFTMRFGGDVSAAEEYFKGFEALLPEDIADSMAYALTRPSHVQIGEIFVLPTNQSSARSIARHS